MALRDGAPAAWTNTKTPKRKRALQRGKDWWQYGLSGNREASGSSIRSRTARGKDVLRLTRRGDMGQKRVVLARISHHTESLRQPMRANRRRVSAL
ncbi:MAG: hypothetical protein AMJ84_02120 [Acidithiobacillales bacterium SM23_46]|nr:MAG: hypothetical protein AMJ84_02120 [Acidithiobacillales bacterium SM23_46]